MTLFNALRELAYGLKLGASYSLSNRHGFTEKVSNPGLLAKDPGH